MRRLGEARGRQQLFVQAKMSGSAPPSGLVTAVFREIEGNPFFIEEVYQHLSEEGKLFDATGAWKADLRVDTIEVPEGVRLLIGRRLGRLGEQARTVLTAAAVIGRTFPLDLLQAVVTLSDDAVFDALEEAERAQLVAADASQRTVRYGGLAHHLNQAGAAADTGRTASFLLMAGRRALAAGAFEETLATFDQMLGLELPASDPLLGETHEHRGEALAGLQRYDDAVTAFDRALTIYSTTKDDAGIARGARSASDCFVWRGQLTAGLSFLTRGLHALSMHAARERAPLLSWMAVVRMSPAYLDEAWQAMAEAAVIAEHLADPNALGRVQSDRSLCHLLCGEFEAAQATAQMALPLVAAELVWERANLPVNLTTPATIRGQFTVCDERLPELATTATRSGNHRALWDHNRHRSDLEAARTGNIRAHLVSLEPLLATPFLRYLTRTGVAANLLYLGNADQALEHLAIAIEEQPKDHALQRHRGGRFVCGDCPGRPPRSGVDVIAKGPSVVARARTSQRRRGVCRARPLRHRPCARGRSRPARRTVSADPRLHPHRFGDVAKRRPEQSATGGGAGCRRRRSARPGPRAFRNRAPPSARSARPHPAADGALLVRPRARGRGGRHR